MFYPLAFGGEGVATIEPVHGAVKRLIGAAKVGRREVGVIVVGQRRKAGSRGPHIR